MFVFQLTRFKTFSVQFEGFHFIYLNKIIRKSQYLLLNGTRKLQIDCQRAILTCSG